MALTKKSERLGIQPILPLLIKLSIPTVMGMAIQALYNVVDTIYIGHVSKDALSALTLAFPVQMVLIALSAGTGAGTTSFISRLLGEGKKRKADNAAEHVIFIGIFYGIIVGICGFLFSDYIIGIYTNSDQLITMGSSYIRIIMIGSICMFTPMLTNSILRGEGNTFVPMLAMMIGAVLNIILDPFLIFGLWFFPELGIKGAAYATVTARLISGIIALSILFSDKNEIKLNLKKFVFRWKIIKEIYRIGFPAMTMQLLTSAMLVGANIIIAGFSETALAVLGIFFRLQSFILMPVIGLGQAVMPLAGYNYGHGNPQRTRETIKYGLLFSSLFVFAGFLLFQTAPRALILMFNDHPELVAIGITALRRISFGFLFAGPSIMCAVIMQGLGKGLPSLFINFSRTIIFLLPAMYILGQLFGLKALWFAFPIGESLTAVIACLWLAHALRRDVKT